MSSTHPIPLVIVQGFLSSAGALIWGDFENASNYACQSNGEPNRRILFANVGPVSSLHDRACELFYSLVGGTVDYGVAHAAANGHGQFGRTYECGLYPEWSVSRPLHFLGHSMGGTTIIKLQRLIGIGFFGAKYHPDMMISVSTISAPFRGTQLVYALGEDMRSAPDVRPFSAGYFLARGVHVVSYLSPLLPGFLDMHVDARRLTYRDCSFASFLKHVWKSEWAESRDAAPYDVTFEAADEREAAGEGVVNHNTYYRSYCASLSRTNDLASPDCRPKSLLQGAMAWPLHFSSRVIASFRFSTLRPIPAFMDTISSAKHAYRYGDEAALETGTIDVDGCGSYLATALRANDGVVPLFSQWHPFECKFTHCRHFSHADDILDGSETRRLRYADPPDAGIWHVHHLAGTHHLAIVPLWLGTPEQRAFWKDLGHWLRSIDHAFVGAAHRPACTM